MDIMLAHTGHVAAVRAFFRHHLNEETDGIYNPELLCPDGVKAAVGRSQVAMAVQGWQIVGALRFYKRKKAPIVSLYQFAIREDFRGQGLLKAMLRTAEAPIAEARCPSGSSFNDYFVKTGWQEEREQNGILYWRLKL